MKIFGKVDSSEQIIDKTANPTAPSGYITMKYSRPETNNNTQYIAQADGTWAVYKEPLDTVYNRRIQEVVTQAEALCEPVLKWYPLIEELSWFVQHREAEAWQEWNDNGQSGYEPQTPMLNKMITAQTGMTKELQVQRVIEKTIAIYETGYVIGARQAVEYQLQAIYEDDGLTDDEKREQLEALEIDLGADISQYTEDI